MICCSIIDIRCSTNYPYHMDAKQVKRTEYSFAKIWVCMWEGNEAKVYEVAFYGPYFF